MLHRCGPPFPPGSDPMAWRCSGRSARPRSSVAATAAAPWLGPLIPKKCPITSSRTILSTIPSLRNDHVWAQSVEVIEEVVEMGWAHAFAHHCRATDIEEEKRDWH